MRRNSWAGQNRRIIPVLLGFLVLIQTVCAIAQDLPAGKPEALGLSSERLERIGAAVQHDIDDKRIAGAVTLVVRHGHVAWFKSQGMMDREAAKPMAPDAMFRICSMTKPITSVAVMILYEEGRFLLDDPVSKYLPEFKNPKVLVKPASGEPYSIPATKEITIRDLSELVGRIVGFPGKIAWDTSKPDGTPRKLMDSSRLFALGWRPKVNLETGIRLAYEDFLARQPREK